MLPRVLIERVSPGATVMTYCVTFDVVTFEAFGLAEESASFTSLNAIKGSRFECLPILRPLVDSKQRRYPRDAFMRAFFARHLHREKRQRLSFSFFHGGKLIKNPQSPS